MKYIAILMFLVLTSCKSKTENGVKVENGIDKTVYTIWDNFIKSNPEFKEDELPESWYFHNNEEDANRLAKLVASGKKTASSGLYQWYKEANAQLPQVGTKHIITNFTGKAQAIIQIKKVDTISFHQISEAYASMDMGTNIDALEKWKKAHWEFFANAMIESGEEPSEEMLVVCERFETIWTEIEE